MNTYFQFISCLKNDCKRSALTDEETCWENLADPNEFKRKVLERGRSGKSLSEWILAGADFSGEDLSGFDLRFACLIGCNFSHCRLTGAHLQQAVLDRASLRSADLTNADLSFAVLGRADLSDADLSGANLECSNLVGIIGHRAKLIEAKMFYSRPGNADFSEADFRKADITRAIFRRAQLVNADFSGAVGQANFENANLQGVKGVKR